LSIYIVLTMRSDFLGDCAQFQGLPEAINDGQYLIPRMTRDERRFAVTGPVGVTRGKISEPLINRLLNDVGDNPDQLPILQHALMRTWEHWQTHRRNGEPIGLEHYEAIGTMSDALSRHADEAFNELPDDKSRMIAERLFKALSDRGADNRETRRPTRLDTICKITGASLQEVISVIEVFRGGGRSFVMPPAGTELYADSVVDISHESLIRNWQRLKQWVNEEAQSVRIYRRVVETAVLHREGSEGLMQDPGLSFALDWREKSHPNAAWGERYHPEFQTAMTYLDQSRDAREEKIAAEQKRRDEEIERDKRELEKTKRFVALQARAARRMRWLIVALCVILLLSFATAVFAWNQRASAIQSRQAAYQDQRNALALAAEAEKLRLEARAEAVKAQTSQFSAEKAQKATEAAKKKADDAAKIAIDQKAIAERNLHVAQAATTRARDATIDAQENAQRFNEARERGELIRFGLESARREEYPRALASFEQLKKKLELLQPDTPGGRNFSAAESKQFVRDYGWTLSRMGDTHHKLREFDKAVNDYEKGRVILERVLKDEPAAILFETYHGLAHAYHDNAKFSAVAVYGEPSAVNLTPEQQLAKAEEYYKKAAAYQEAALKSSNPLAAMSSLKNLAQLYLDIGRYDDAEKRLQDVVEAYKKVESTPGDGTFDALKELAEFYRSRSRYEDAVRTYNELIDMQEQVTDTQSDPEAIRALSDNYNELSQLYNVLKDEVRSEAAFHLAERIQQIVLKLRNQRDLIADLKKLAVITLDDDLDVMGDSYVTLGRFTEAAHAFESSLGIREAIKSENSSIATSYLKLGDLYREQLKKYDQAEEYYKRLIQNRKSLKGSLMGPSDPLSQYVLGLRKLALLYADNMNKPTEAEALLNEAAAKLAPINGRLSWDDELNVYDDLLNLYQKQQKDALAVKVRKLEAFTRDRNDFAVAYRSPDYQQFMYVYILAAGDIADLYLKQQNKAAAEAAYANVFGFMRLSSNFLDAEKLNNYLNNVEKYQTLLRENNKAAKAAELDDFIKEGRTRQKDLESIQKESQTNP
jgi:tetratricopeptide (TPR) repeat protein